MVDAVEESKRQEVCKYDIPNVLYMILGTQANGFYVHFQCKKTNRESFQHFDTAKEAIARANQLYEAHRTVPATVQKGL